MFCVRKCLQIKLLNLRRSLSNSNQRGVIKVNWLQEYKVQMIFHQRICTEKNWKVHIRKTVLWFLSVWIKIVLLMLFLGGQEVRA